jgi:hypothetical protein
MPRLRVGFSADLRWESGEAGTADGGPEVDFIAEVMKEEK